jgi:hypothetical protein
MPRWLRALTWLMLLLYVFGAVVQYNDPDPVRWMAIYAAAAVTCVLALRGRMPRWLPAVVALVAIAWSATLLPGVIGKVSPGEMVEAFEMKSERVEVAREGYGLAIIAVWMIVLFVWGRGRRATRA